MKKLLLATALVAAPFAASAASVISSGVSGGCATDAYAGGIGQIDALAGASWTAFFEDGDAADACLFDVNNTSATSKVVTLAVVNVNQSDDWGFDGGASLSGAVSDSFTQGVAYAKEYSFHIAAGGTAWFDWSWGEAYDAGGAGPFINFSLKASEVPVPAAGFLLLGGLGGLAAMKRRKKA